MNKLSTQPWIYSPFVDTLFVLLPPFLALGLILLFPMNFQSDGEMSVLAWGVLVLGIDVAHVYSTLYRTYFDKETFSKQKNLLLLVPVAGWMVGVMVYSLDIMLFWRLLAYVAVFHFIRQQYGFMRIYSRKLSLDRIFSLIDTVAIYGATLYPLLYWHLHPDRNFEWFVKGDFLFFQVDGLAITAWIGYVFLIGAYLLKEIILTWQTKYFNLPKNAIIAGTFVSWYFGIVYYNGDLLFTMLNVISHGIPYMALVWIYGRKKHGKPSLEGTGNRWLSVLFKRYGIVLFLGIILLLAYLEEGIWDAMVWHDHQPLFSAFYGLPKLSDHQLLALLVPLLALPQITHYILDGFIWKISKDGFNWKNTTLGK